MSEIKLRIQIITDILGHKYKLPDQPAYELCYLQLRLICELIALGALAVHGDIPATRSGRMRAAVAADWIMNALEKLHPSSYPVPGTQLVYSDGSREFAPTSGDYLTKPLLLKLYTQCGEVLHRGSFKHIRKQRDLDFNEIGTHLLRIVRLLASHRIALHGTEDEFWVLMNTAEPNKVSATLVRSI